MLVLLIVSLVFAISVVSVCLHQKKRMHSNTHGTGAVSLSVNVSAAVAINHLQHIQLDDYLCVA